MRIAFTTLGCKINQYETEKMRRDLLERGNSVVPFHEQADAYIINTCTVTAKSDYQCRQAIRSAVRRGQGATVVVTGCYAETRPEEIETIPGVNLVMGNGRKAGIPDAIMNGGAPSDHFQEARGETPVRSRTRGFLKIQDGCNNRCSYCIVPAARGRSRSMAPGSVMKEFETMVRDGCPEIVLSGIHIGAYGADLGHPMDLTRLVRALLNRRGAARVRLSSIEPGEITQELIDLLGEGLCRHLHIPLQSGDDAILAAMRRDYSSGFYQHLLEGLAKHVPGIALGADVMVGFPGEGEREFRNTLLLIENAPLTHLHVFSYSPRPGTDAATMKDQVPEQAKKERNEAIRMLAKRKNFTFRKKNEGTILKVAVEGRSDERGGALTGLTDNYIRVAIQGLAEENIGKEILVKVTEVTDSGTTASVI